nr:putative Gag-polypeptide of LTR copia-type [Tanacetum cinerariifolium]
MAIGDASGSNNDSINGIDGGDPLHMNPNDSTSSSLIPFKLIGLENYRIWASAMKLSLQARNKFAFVNGNYVKSAYSTSKVLSAQWDRCNVMVLTWIINSMSIDVYMGLVYSIDAVTVWKDLESTYNKKITIGHPNGTLFTVGHVGNLKLTKNVILLGHPADQVLAVLKEDLKLSKTINVYACEETGDVFVVLLVYVDDIAHGMSRGRKHEELKLKRRKN